MDNFPQSLAAENTVSLAGHWVSADLVATQSHHVRIRVIVTHAPEEPIEASVLAVQLAAKPPASARSSSPPVQLLETSHPAGSLLPFVENAGGATAFGDYEFANPDDFIPWTVTVVFQGERGELHFPANSRAQ